MKNILFLGLLIIIVLIPIGIWMQTKSKERGKRNFKDFYSTEINSQIESVGIKNKGSGIKLSNGQEFVFYPFTDDNLNGGNLFNYTAEKGDKIIKHAYSDTLYLIQDDRKLAYTFKKF